MSDIPEGATHVWRKDSAYRLFYRVTPAAKDVWMDDDGWEPSENDEAFWSEPGLVALMYVSASTSTPRIGAHEFLERGVKHAHPAESLSQRYPKYYKPVGDLTEVDVYAVHQLFSLNDVSGCIHHASKKLLLSGVRTGGKTKQQDIREARDTLNRWLELNGEAAQ